MESKKRRHRFGAKIREFARRLENKPELYLFSIFGSQDFCIVELYNVQLVNFLTSIIPTMNYITWRLYSTVEFPICIFFSGVGKPILILE